MHICDSDTTCRLTPMKLLGNLLTHTYETTCWHTTYQSTCWHTPITYESTCSHTPMRLPVDTHLSVYLLTHNLSVYLLMHINCQCTHTWDHLSLHIYEITCWCTPISLSGDAYLWDYLLTHTYQSTCWCTLTVDAHLHETTCCLTPKWHCLSLNTYMQLYLLTHTCSRLSIQQPHTDE